MSISVLSSDREFDSIYEKRIRDLSEVHWTPVQVAARAATLLTEAGATRILDLGSGAGKFCIVGALTTTARFVGVERRGHLVEVARRAAGALRAERTTFVQADAESFPFEGFDGLYLYNPYYEQISRFMVQIDDTTERSRDVYRRLVQSTLAKLAAAKPPVRGRNLRRFRSDHAARLHVHHRRAGRQRSPRAVDQAVVVSRA